MSVSGILGGSLGGGGFLGASRSASATASPGEGLLTTMGNEMSLVVTRATLSSTGAAPPSPPPSSGVEANEAESNRRPSRASIIGTGVVAVVGSVAVAIRCFFFCCADMGYLSLVFLSSCGATWRRWLELERRTPQFQLSGGGYERPAGRS